MLPVIVWGSLVACGPLLVVCAAWGEASLPAAVAGASWTGLGAALYLGVATAAYAIWGGLLGRYPAATVAPLVLLSPVVGVGASAAVFGERFGAVRLAGMGLILCGLVVVLLPPGRGRLRPGRA